MRNRPKRPATTPNNRERRTEILQTVGVVLAPVGSEDEVFGWLVTLNTRGMMVRCDDRIPPETECTFCLMLDDGEREVSGLGWIVEVDERGMSVQFDELVPQTRKIIERTAGPFTIPEGKIRPVPAAPQPDDDARDSGV